MNIEDLQNICNTHKGVTQDIKWEEHLCFNVCKKMFLITSPDSFPVTASFKTTNDDFEMLTARHGFKPAPHLARNKWVYITDISILTYKEWQHYIAQSYNLVVSKLPKKTQKEISLL